VGPASDSRAAPAPPRPSPSGSSRRAPRLSRGRRVVLFRGFGKGAARALGKVATHRGGDRVIDAVPLEDPDRVRIRRRVGGEGAGGDHGRVVAGDVRQEQRPCGRGLRRAGEQSPLTSERCLRTALNDAMSAPARRRRRNVSAFSSIVIPAAGEESMADPAARHEGDHEVAFSGSFQKRQDLARRREAEDVGDRVPGRRESHRARRPFRAARHGDHPARDAFPERRESRLPHRPSGLSGPDEVDLPQGRKGGRRPTPGASSTTASPSTRSADATRRAGSAASTAARKARSSRSFPRGLTRVASDRLAPGQPALRQGTLSAPPSTQVPSCRP